MQPIRCLGGPEIARSAKFARLRSVFRDLGPVSRAPLSLGGKLSPVLTLDRPRDPEKKSEETKLEWAPRADGWQTAPAARVHTDLSQLRGALPPFSLKIRIIS